MDKRKRSITIRIVKHWNRVPRALGASSMEAFNSRLDGALGNLV